MTSDEFIKKFPTGSLIEFIDSKEVFKVAEYVDGIVYLEVVISKSQFLNIGQRVLLPPTLFNNFKMKERDGKPGEWYQDESIGGYYDEYGRLIVVEEYGTDADFDRHAVDVANGNGYYDDDGRYVSYGAID